MFALSTGGRLRRAFRAACRRAQTYPAKPVRIIVPYAAGGNTDFTARAIAERLTPVFKQQVIVDNRPGGATNIGTEAVAKAAPDGYTLLMGGASNAINMSLFAKLPYDTLRDFEPITLCVQGANVLAVHPSVPAKNLKGADRARESAAGQAQFRFERPRQLEPDGGRALEADGRHQHRARAPTKATRRR